MSCSDPSARRGTYVLDQGAKISAFEFSFGLISLLLGLGMAHLAGALARLVIAGRKVQWDWLPLLAALLTFQSTLVYWWFQWALREQSVSLADLTFRAVACLLLYMLAVVVLPEQTRGRPNLKDHFERSNWLFFGVLGTHVWLVGVVYPGYNRLIDARPWEVPWPNLILIGLCILASVWRRRWLHAVVMLYFLVGINRDWITQVIAG